MRETSFFFFFGKCPRAFKYVFYNFYFEIYAFKLLLVSLDVS